MKNPVPTLVVFCKRPKLNQGKQRLTQDTSPESALAIANALLACAIEDARAWAGRVVLACAHQQDISWMQAQLPEATIIGQLPLDQDGNLGERINYIDSQLRKLGHRQTFYIGTDAPMLDKSHFLSALDGLNEHDIALSHARDGGVVIMANRTPWPNIKHLPWSTDKLGESLANACLNQGLTVTSTLGGYDIDYVADIKILYQDLQGDPRPARQKLLKLISDLFFQDVPKMTQTSSCCSPSSDTNKADDATRDSVKDYYGKVLESSEDLQTNACCTDDSLSPQMKTVLSNIHDEVLTRYYGCGLVTPESLEGCHILDLGCGAGRDCYALAQLVGEQGSVIGVDMTDEQLAVANKYIEHHQQKFGYAEPNTRFLKGYIEKLDELNIPDNSIDIVISNCVINLSPDKHAVLKEVFRILKPGGEIYFSDVYADRRVPRHLVNDPLLYGECLSGALYWNDFENLAKQVGFAEPRLVTSRAITIDNNDLAAKLDDIRFTSATYRLFKAEQLEPQPQDYGQQVVYLGTIPEHEKKWQLDTATSFTQGLITHVNGNVWHSLKQSRFSQHFEFINEGDGHLGFDQSQKLRTSLDFDFRTSSTVPSSSCCAPAQTNITSCC
ncbi:DUF2064 domain-containing protein [Parashewanella curva]|uniref:Arsenite methyltransferase n=1 Tax=Parashewanella curva TaxID=2338552 RepID=A0A3L8Q0D3_9GAMM|nr:DUF2064 domain-containing protein [Parashewanella curva]RLV61156.1 DUF2064 domain-containing protein [Parashewanella curva]